MAENKSSLNNCLTSLLAIVNSEQDLHLPPDSVFSPMYNIVSSELLTQIAKAFPTNNRVIDIAEPFLFTKTEFVIDGYVSLPKDYRNFLDAGIAVNNKEKCECDEIKKSVKQLDVAFKKATLKSGCERRPLVIVDQSQWDYMTTDPFDYPTYENPIGCFFGKQQIKVCPFDITAVEIRILKNEGTYRFGYTLQPDDTYIYNPATTIESEWGNNAFSFLFKGLMTCYAAYAENNNLRDFSTIIKQVGLI